MAGGPAVDALDRGDVEGAFSSAAPDAEFDQTRAVGMDNRVYTRDEFRHLTETFISAWESVRWLADEFIDAGEHVVMPFTNRLTGRDGDAQRYVGVEYRRGCNARRPGSP